ncbi:MAG: DUF3006 domain-containing protein [Clostridia bacterium]|nr:DUF3006 domain-containing protein [Clostridia bacterium]
MATKNSSQLYVDRVEDGIVIMMDEKEAIYRVTTEMLGFVPHDGDVLCVCVDADGIIKSASVDEKATADRKAAMREKLLSLLG